MADTEQEQQQASSNAPLPAPEEQTLRQADDAMAAAVELSKAAAQQSDYAPDIPGYALSDLLGEGAFGQVWRGVQLRTTKEVAIKVFIQRGGLDWIFLQREVERLTRLDRHPHVVTLLDTDLENDPPFYVMDLIEAGSLQQFVDSGEREKPGRVLRWMNQICDALTYVHSKGLIHCDLKPANILLDEQNNVRVVDFGQSRVFTESAASLGTLYYMAPEQAQLDAPGRPIQPDVRWDVYALGATIHAILIGRPPLATEQHDKTLSEAGNLEARLESYRKIASASVAPIEKSAGIGRELAAIIKKCLEADPEKRYETVAEVQADIAALRANRPVSPLFRSRPYRIKKFVQRNPLGIGLVIAAMILLPSLYVARQKQIAANQSEARDLIASFVYAPEEALPAAMNAGSQLKNMLAAHCADTLNSPAFTMRIMGARAGPIVNPDAFWNSVDSGLLWTHGEWLELLEVDWPDADWLAAILEEKARNGSDRQKYASFCLIGQLAREDGPLRQHASELGKMCAAATASESQPGVVAAAGWAARQSGELISFRQSDQIVPDENSGLVFVRLAGDSAYRRGAARNDRDQFYDEIVVENPITIPSIFLSMTEVTMSSIQPFVNSVASDSAIVENTNDGQSVREIIRGDMASLPRSDQDRIAAGWMSLNAARKYCEWLTEKSQSVSPKRRYRLPTEEEWEYACRGGNLGRFCYGNDPSYAKFFANCNGSTAFFHRVADRMPNWYGLFDMHGGLWELCDSRYEDKFLRNAQEKGKQWYVIRGGAYYGPAIRCRSTQRNIAEANGSTRHLGFRLVMEIDN